jgi:quinol monooxygenase YgiN
MRRNNLAAAILLLVVTVVGAFAYRAYGQAQGNRTSIPDMRDVGRSMLLVADALPQAPAAAPAPAQPAGPVHVVTFVDITPNNREAGTELLKQYVSDTRKDPGVTRAELLVQSNRNNHLMLDIVYQNQAAYDRHVEAQHTKDFMNKMIPMIGAPFDERPHYALQ